MGEREPGRTAGWETIKPQEQEFEKTKAARKVEDTYIRLTVGALTVIGALVRLVYISQPLRYDEIITFFSYTASKPVALALAKNNPPCNPLFHTLLVNISTRIFGNAEWAIRLPVFLAGVIAIPLAYVVFKKLFNKWVGLITAALVTASSMLITYSTNARAYSVQSVLVLVLLLLAVQVKGKRSTWGWVLIVVFATLSFYAMPTTLYFFGAIAIWLALSSLLGDTAENRWLFLGKLTGSCFAIAVLTLILYIPVFQKSGLATVTANPMVKPLPLSYFIEGTARLAADTWKSWNLNLNPVFGLLLAMGLVASVVFHRRMSKDRVNLVLVIIGWSALLLLLQRSVANERHWLPLLPIYFGFAAAGLYYVGSRAMKYVGGRRVRPLKLSVGFLCIVILAFTLFQCTIVYSSGFPYQTDATGWLARDTSFRDVKKITASLKNELRAGDIVYVDHLAAPTLEYYFQRSGLPVGYIYGNMHGAENADSPSRVFVIEAFAEGHTVEFAVKDQVTEQEWSSAHLFKKTGDSRIFVIERAR